MIETRPREALRLFDLIGREWRMEAPVRRLAFNAAASAVACAAADGSVALLPMADAEAPETRVRMEFDTGRASIRPREKPVPPATAAQARAAPEGPGLCRLGAQGFAVAGPDGALTAITARGQAAPLSAAGEAAVAAFCAIPGREAICVARGARLSLTGPGGGAPHASATAAGPVARLAASADGARIAVASPGRLHVLRAEDLSPCPGFPAAGVPVDGEALSLAWSPDGRWIVAGCAERRLAVIDVARGAADRIEGFPGPVAAAAFSPAAGALLASGAFRAVGWRGPDLPFGGHPGDPVETGRPGLTLVERIAPNPVRDSCAVGYASGLVTLCRIGLRDELMLVEDAGAAVTALDWSDDGRHLAIGFADGRAAIATFPKVMFK